MHCIQPDPCVSFDLNQLVFDLNQLVLPVFDLNQACFRPEPAGFRPELLVFDLNQLVFDLTHPATGTALTCCFSSRRHRLNPADGQKAPGPSNR